MIKKLSLHINDILTELFLNVNIKLIDFKLEFGRSYNDQTELLLADEISPDTCRLWDISTGKKLDKDCYRLNLGNVIERYREVGQRLHALPDPLHHKNF